MTASKLAAALLVFVGLAASASAATNPAVWSPTFTTTTAYGTFSGVDVTAVSTSSSPFVGLMADRFAGGWDGTLTLDSSAMALTASYVNGGDSQAFGFSAPLSEGLFYIDNFESSSSAEIIAHGATSLTLIDASSSISFTSLGANSGQLVTSNAGYDGEGDAVLQFSGDVTSIQVIYDGGEGANGIMYTFAEPGTEAVPEPTSALVVAGLFGIGGICGWRRRKKA